jgi:transposase
MVVIGVDVAKADVVAVRTDKSGQQKEVFNLPNTSQALSVWVGQLKRRYAHLLVASESTAEYHRNVAMACLEQDVPYRLINPITTKQFTKATIRKRKTDLSDALIIAKLAMMGEGTKVKLEMMTLAKPINRASVKLMQIHAQFALMKHRFMRLDPNNEVLLAQLNLCLQSVKQASLTFRAQVVPVLDAHLIDLLRSIPGIGVVVATTCIAEIGDIHRFTHANALIAFAGLDPRIKQSGKGLKHNTHLTKRGSPVLRKMVFVAANIASMHDPELKAYYQKKRLEGKQYREAVCAVGRKILYRIYAVWKRGTPYLITPVTA